MLTSTERWHRWNERRKLKGEGRPERKRDRRAYEQGVHRRRLAENRCVKCGEKKPEGDTFKVCGPCRKYFNDYLRDLRAGNPRRPGRPPQSESTAWKRLDSLERCPHCHLLLPHETCLASVYELASSRRGGPTMPEGA